MVDQNRFIPGSDCLISGLGAGTFLGVRIRCRLGSGLILCGKIHTGTGHYQTGGESGLACALSALARALADKGKKEEASRVAAEAVSAVGQKKLNKDYSAYATACALAQGGLTGDVMAVIHQLEDEGQRAAKLVNAVHAAVQSGKTEEALALAAAPEIDGYRVWALSAVAQALARIGRMEEADRLARKAQAVAEEQLSVYGANEAGLLVEAAQALAKVGRTAEANNLAQRAMAMAPQISSERVRNQMAYGVAVLLARQGKVQEAKAIIHGQSTDGSGEATLFALELAEAGHVSEAIATSRETNDETALRRVAKVLARAAKVKEALTSARQLKDPGDRVEALSAAAQAAEAGKIGEASTIAKESLGYARRVTDDYQRSSALSQVAGAFAQLHSYREARLIADRDTSSSDKLSAYAAILREYTVQHHPELGRFF